MNWIEAKIYTTTEGIEPLSAILLDAAVGGFSVEDAGEFEEFLADTRVHWDYIDEEVLKLKNCETNLTFYLPDTGDGYDTLHWVRDAVSRLKEGDREDKLGRLAITVGNVREEDWAENWKKYFKPVPVGNKLLIKPSWEQVEDAGGRIILEIDPKMSFGTGTHATTHLCMAALEDAVHESDRVLDMGCGSGILSVAALLLGAGSALGIDVDPLAVKTAMENARINGVDGRFVAKAGNVLEDEELIQSLGLEYDIIAANIVSDIIIAMSGLFYKLLKKGGSLITSGIIDERCNEVIAALEQQGFAIERTDREGGWCAITASR